jgi:hypothetical protein
MNTFKDFFELLANVRVGIVEAGGTVVVLFLTIYGTRKAWEDFMVPIVRKSRVPSPYHRGPYIVRSARKDPTLIQFPAPPSSSHGSAGWERNTEKDDS